MDKKNYSAPALDKGLDILELLAVSSTGLTQAEIAEHLNKSVNEIYRMLNTLKVRNYLEFDSSTDSYKLSYKLLNLSASFNPTKTLLQKAIWRGMYYLFMKERKANRAFCLFKSYMSTFTSAAILQIT